MIEILVSVGEAVDRLTILRIKARRITDVDKRNRAVKQGQHVKNAIVQSIGEKEFGRVVLQMIQLAGVNQELWDAEDAIREIMGGSSTCSHEASAVSMQIARLNDKRFQVKQEIDEELNDTDNGEVKELPSYGE